MVDAATASASAAASAAATGASAALPALKLAGPVPMLNNPGYAALDNLANADAVLVFILLLVKFGRGFVANISVLLGIVAGCVVASALGGVAGRPGHCRRPGLDSHRLGGCAAGAGWHGGVWCRAVAGPAQPGATARRHRRQRRAVVGQPAGPRWGLWSARVRLAQQHQPHHGQLRHQALAVV